MVDPQVFKGLLVFALIITVYHFIYYHILGMMDMPMEMIGLIIVLVVINYLALANKIKIKR